MTGAALPRKLAKRALRAGSSAAVRAMGRDSTEELSRETLVLAPHPDDETLGCGATIARLRSRGIAVHVVLVSDGGLSPRPAGMSRADLVRLRREEAQQALERLGVGESCTTFWDFEDGALTQEVDGVADRIQELLRVHSPRQLLVTSAHDRHPDHVAVALAARAAVAKPGPSVSLLEYPIWQRAPAITVARQAVRAMSLRGDSRRASPVPVPRLVSSDGFLGSKRRALDAYASQLPHLPVGFVEDFMLPYEAFTEIRVPGRADVGPQAGRLPRSS
jgi:LmbE family N-acetylglucosaminyl deacetylase